jgi:hypothetical protein
MANNNFKVFDESKTNIMSDTDYENHTQRKKGVQSGVASSAMHNKLYRQVSMIGKAVADFIQSQDFDANDADAQLLSENLSNALNKFAKVPLDTHNTNPNAHATGISGNAATATRLKVPRKIGITGKVHAEPVWFDGSEGKDIVITKVLESEKAVNDAAGNKIDTTYLQLIGGTLTGDLINKSKYVKKATSIDSTAIGSGEDEEIVVMACDKNDKLIGQINIIRQKNNKNVQLRHRVVNKGWSDLRVVQDDNGNYWAEYAGGAGTDLQIPQNDNSKKIPTTAWVANATTAAAKKLDTAKAIKIVGDFITGSEKTFDGTQNINIPLDLDKTIKNARIVASLLNPSSGYIKWANGLIAQWGHGTIPSTVTSPDTPFEASYPMAFPNSCFILVGNDVGSAAYTLAFYPISNTKFKIWRRHPNFGYSGETGFQYIAIGK